MMKDCKTLEELQIELDFLAHRMTGLQATLTGLAGEGANATAGGVMAARQEFLEVKAEQYLRTFQIQEAQISGEVTAGSLQRACARIQEL
jgi:hypothetical protein